MLGRQAAGRGVAGQQQAHEMAGPASLVQGVPGRMAGGRCGQQRRGLACLRAGPTFRDGGRSFFLCSLSLNLPFTLVSTPVPSSSESPCGGGGGRDGACSGPSAVQRCPA